MTSTMGAVAQPESDEDYRARIANAYGMWGSFLTEVMESSGAALDECGESIGVRRSHGLTPSDHYLAKERRKFRAHLTVMQERPEALKWAYTIWHGCSRGVVAGFIDIANSRWAWAGIALVCWLMAIKRIGDVL